MEALEKYGLNKSMYLSYLIGKDFDEKMLMIDYNKVTFPLKTFIKDAQVALVEQSLAGYRHKELNRLSETSFTTFNSIYKCITFDMPTHKNSQMIVASIVSVFSVFR